jgi:hypothetical protein|nr:MAG TPA: hypothetical protein [Caudoviricetes sp.]
MAYTPTVWKNGEFPPIDAEHLNKIEQGIANSAPGGFGLGENMGKKIGSLAELDAIDKNGIYFYYNQNESIGGYPYGQNGAVLHIRDDRCHTQFFFPGGTDTRYWMRTRYEFSKTWGAWEFVKVPMELGVEYRTTERYMGKPVYTKVVNCGNLPDGTTAEVAHGIANVGIVVGAQAIASNGTGVFNGLVYLPSIYNGSLTDRWTAYLAGVDAQNIRIFCGGGLAGCPVYVTMRYTKTTD